MSQDRLYHITAIRNLPALLQCGELRWTDHRSKSCIQLLLEKAACNIGKCDRHHTTIINSTMDLKAAHPSARLRQRWSLLGRRKTTHYSSLRATASG